MVSDQPCERLSCVFGLSEVGAVVVSVVWNTSKAVMAEVHAGIFHLVVQRVYIALENWNLKR